VALTKAMRAAADAAVRRIPVLGLTADVTEAQRVRCAEAGMTHLAIKPLTIYSLATLMRSHLPAAVAAAPPAEARPVQAPTGLPFNDQAYLSVFRPGEPDGAAWLTGYLQGAQAACAELTRLAALAPESPGRADTLRSVAHRLAGTSFDSGAMLLGHAARALENARHDEGLDAHLQAVLASLRTTQLAIGAFLQTNEPSDRLHA
jgi:CheY-like chemotaxis protein